LGPFNAALTLLTGTIKNLVMTKIQSEVVHALKSPVSPSCRKDEIKGGQDVIRANILHLDSMVHDNAVQCMMHAFEFGGHFPFACLLIDVLGRRLPRRAIALRVLSIGCGCIRRWNSRVTRSTFLAFRSSRHRQASEELPGTRRYGLVVGNKRRG